MKCQHCGTEINLNAKFCENCGAPVKNSTQTQAGNHSAAQNNMPNGPVQQKKKGLSTGAIVGITLGSVFGGLFIILVLLFIIGISFPSDSDTNISNSITTSSKAPQTVTEAPTTEPIDLNKEAQDKWREELENEEYSELDSSVLYEYAEYYIDSTVLTAVNIKEIDKSDGIIKVDTENNDSLFFSIIFNFDDETELDNYNTGDIVEVYGVVKEKSTLGDTVQVYSCHIVSSGEIANSKMDTLSENINFQKEEVEKLKEALEKEQSEKDEKSEAEFKNSCSTIDYDTISRNPDKYKGNNYKFTGEVIQVQESSWSNTVELRVNITKHTYEYIDGEYYEDPIYCTVEIPDGADRILDDDIITFWGTCDGLYTYTSILGSSVSVPKIDIKYYEIN